MSTSCTLSRARRPPSRLPRKPSQCGDRRNSAPAPPRNLPAVHDRAVRGSRRLRCPSPAAPPAMAAIRSLSLTRSSPIPEKRRLAARNGCRGTNSTGNSSIARDTSAGSTSIPLSSDERTRDRRPAPRRRGADRLSSANLAPMSRRMSMTPVRVGLTPTPPIVTSAASDSSAANDDECCRRQIGGHADVDGSQRCLGAVHRRSSPPLVSTTTRPSSAACVPYGRASRPVRSMDTLSRRGHTALPATWLISPARSPRASV